MRSEQILRIDRKTKTILMAKTKKTLPDKAAKELCQAVATAMLDKKAQNVVSLNLSSIDGAISTYFVICNADSTTQVDAIANNVEDHVRKTLEQKPRRTEGFENSLWILLDYVDVIVHVFQTEMRDFYRIEQLWADAEHKLHTDEPPVKKVTAKKVAAAPKKTAVKKTTTTVKKKAATAKTASVAKKAAVAKPAAKKTTAVKKTTATKKTAAVKKTAAKK